MELVTWRFKTRIFVDAKCKEHTVFTDKTASCCCCCWNCDKCSFISSSYHLFTSQISCLEFPPASKWSVKTYSCWPVPLQQWLLKNSNATCINTPGSFTCSHQLGNIRVGFKSTSKCIKYQQNTYNDQKARKQTTIMTGLRPLQDNYNPKI